MNTYIHFKCVCKGLGIVYINFSHRFFFFFKVKIYIDSMVGKHSERVLGRLS